MVQTRQPDDQPQDGAASDAPTQVTALGSRPASSAPLVQAAARTAGTDGRVGDPQAVGTTTDTGTRPADGASGQQTEAAETVPPAKSARPDQPAIVIPDRPQLAPGIELCGQMKESGFQEEPWLVQRDGKYIQITEMLYKVAEAINGQRTFDDLAAAVSESTGRGVTADNVKQLTGKLIPLGIVANGDGKVFAAAGQGGRSPLAVNMKMAMVDPRYIGPFTKVLQVLFWPPVLVVALLISAVAQAWLFFMHGVGGSIRDAFYSPGLLLAALGFVIFSAAFHELGHAAALRYGGGRVGGMGAGLYIIYPAFYTDVSDNYRLGRWAKVRTDLGGFYFNLIFGLGVMALYAVTGAEFLLIVVVLLNMDIVRQSMPFVRLDGYWALADLTGIPDFFSNIKPFLRSVLPLKSDGRKLPALKTWVKVIYALYLIVTIPLLLLLLLAMIRSVPRVLATAWDSFGNLGGELSRAWSGADWLGVAAAAIQMVTLALPTFGLVFVLFTLGRGLLRALWRWSKPTPTRRVAGTLGTAGLAAMLAFFWAPGVLALLPGDSGGGPVRAQASPWRPVGPTERGTVGDAVRDVPVVGRPLANIGATSPLPAVTPTVTPTETAAATATATSTAAAAAAATATVTATPGASPTSTATGAAGAAGTPERGATLTATPGATAAASAASTPGIGTPGAGTPTSGTPAAGTSGAVTARATGTANVRSGPGTGFAVVRTLAAGDAVTVSGRSADSAWLRLSGGTAGWVAADLLQLASGTLSGLPVVSAATGEPAATGRPPRAAQSATATATATPAARTATSTPSATSTPPARTATAAARP